MHTIITPATTSTLDPQLVVQCSWCQRLKIGADTWIALDPPGLPDDVTLTHGICPDCKEAQSVPSVSSVPLWYIPKDQRARSLAGPEHPSASHLPPPASASERHLQLFAVAAFLIAIAFGLALCVLILSAILR